MMNVTARELVRPYWRFVEHLHFNTVRRETLFFASTFYAGITLVCTFVILAISGVLLMYYYIPTEDGSFRSIRFLEEHLRYGGLIRAMHYYAAHLMVFALFVHLISLIVRKAYLRRKWANWLVGMLLFVLTITLSYTGYLLPYDQLGYWAIMVGSNMAGSAPVLGPVLKQIMIGGEVVSDITLIRFYVHHCITIAALFCLLLSLHLYLIRRDKGLTLLGLHDGSEDYIQSRPTLYAFEIGFFVVISLLLTSISLWFQAPLGTAANPAVTPNPMKAPWYLVGLQELLHFHSPVVVSYAIPGVLLLAVAVLPLLPDRYRTMTLAESSWGSRVLVYTTLALVVFASVVPAYHENIVLVINCSLFSGILFLAQPGRRLHARIGRATLLSYLLLFVLLSLALATLMGNFFRGPNWELAL